MLTDVWRDGNGEWKSRTNRELEEMSKGENIVKWVKGQRIRSSLKNWKGREEGEDPGKAGKRE